MAITQKQFENIDQEFKEEKSFFSIFKNSFVYDRLSFKIVLGFLILFIILVVLYYPLASSSKTADSFTSFIDIGINISVGILGFLIAGFTIYSTMIDKDLVYLLILYKDDGKNISKFKHNNLIFFKPFGIFFFFLCIAVSLKFLLPIWMSIDYYRRLQFFFRKQIIYNIFVSIIISLFVSLAFIALYSLKIFMFNIYESTKSMGRLTFYKKNCNISAFEDSLLQDNEVNNDNSDNSSK